MIIPAYNGKEFLSDCVSSVLSQHYENFEIVIIDDGSTDGTYNLACSFRTEKPLSVIRHERNLGLAATYNHGLEVSQGKFILLLHQDCRLDSNDWLEKALKHLRAGARVAVVSGRALLDLNSMSFAQRTFTFLRNIISSRNPSPLEVIPFFEGKCDLCKKEILLALGGFPSHEFRLSGEDQVVSYTLRRRGYKILRDNTLTFREEISEGLRTNFRKDFVHGKTQAGITLRFGLFQLTELDKSPHVKTRAIGKLSRLATVFVICMFSIVGLIFDMPQLMVLPLLIVGSRFLFFMFSSLTYLTNFTFVESLAVAILGIMTDFLYTLGFLYGLFSSVFGKKL